MSHSFKSEGGVESFLANNLKLIFALIPVFIAISLVFSIGLLRRKNWGRIGIISLFSLGLIQIVVVNVFLLATGRKIAVAPSEMDNFMKAMRVMSIIFTMAYATFFLYSIRKLQTKAIKAEFDNN